jgi:hypothetical protein
VGSTGRKAVAFAVFAAVVASGASALAARSDGGSSPRQGTPLPTYTASDSYPGALLTGRLELRGGCVYLTRERDRRALLVWSPGTRLTRSEGRTRIVSASGKVRGEIGQTVRFGGGETGPGASMVGEAQFDCPWTDLAIVNP